MGTNLFFEETDDNPHTGNTFEKQTPICLKYVLSSTKLLNLQQVKIPQTKARIPNEVKHINYNLNWDYQELLQKFEDGTLQIEDISLGEMCSQNVEVEDEKTEQNDEIQSNEIPIDCETEPEREEKLENVLTDIMPVTILEAEYAQLNELARRPVRRVVSPELVAECDKKYEEAYEYHNIERQVRYCLEFISSIIF